MKDIKDLFTNEFLTLFKSKLESIFPYPIDRYFAECNTGTYGWAKALDETCNEFGRLEIKEYYDSLQWDVWDKFSVELGELMIEKGIIK